MKRLTAAFFVCTALSFIPPALAGGQQYETLSASVKALMASQIVAGTGDTEDFISVVDKANWIAAQAEHLQKRFSSVKEAHRFLDMVYYEASRAGLDPELVLAVIDVESKFNRYAVSVVGARGLMQVMPFWTDELGEGENDLFTMRTNLRYGCTILRHYLDLESGNLFYALGRYNGSRGSRVYPDLIMNAWARYRMPPPASQTRSEDALLANR